MHELHIPEHLRPAAFRLWRELALKRGQYDISPGAFAACINSPDKGRRANRLYIEFWQLWEFTTSSGAQAPLVQPGSLLAGRGKHQQERRAYLQQVEQTEAAQEPAQPGANFFAQFRS